MKRQKFIAALVLLFSLLKPLLALASGPRADSRVVLDLPRGVPVKQRTFDLRSDQGSRELLRAAETLMEFSEAQEKEWQQARKEKLRYRPLAELSQSELKDYFHRPDQLLTERDRRGLSEIRRLAVELPTATPRERDRLVGLIQEIASAISNNRRTPAPRNLDLLQAPWVFWDQWRSPVARGRIRAANLGIHRDRAMDLSTLDPQPSTFWRPPPSIPDEDLYHGFGRSELPRFEDELCVYLAPKTTYGANPGFEVRCGRREIKVKFAETTSEPFAARIFHALGYHVDPTDHVRQLKIRYDRRLFREFHLRKEITTTCRFLGVIPAFKIKLQRRFDPFDYFSFALLKDGSRLSVAELEQALFHDPGREHPEDDPGNFKPEFEARIDHLVTVPANIQVKDPGVGAIGPWDFGQLGHENLRELRGLALLAAWLGWYDTRYENTRLKIVEANGRRELIHYLSDVGGGLGRGAGFYSGRGELPNEFDWTFTQAPVSTGKGRMAMPFRVVGFKPMDDTRAFEAMTIDDARWMARLIGQLTENQIIQALTASGYDSAHVRLYTEKLISRRDRMIQDLGLTSEIALFREHPPHRALCYDPQCDGAVQWMTRNGDVVSVRTGSVAVVGGRVTSGDPEGKRSELARRP